MCHEPCGWGLGVGTLWSRRLLSPFFLWNLVVPQAASPMTGALQNTVQGWDREVVVVLLRPVNTHTHTQKWLKGTPESAEYHPSTLSPVVSIFSFPGTKSLFLFVMQSVSSFKPSLKTFFFSHPWVCSWFFIPFAKYSCLKVVKTQWREPPFCAHQSASILSETKPACVANVSNRSQAMCVYACTRLSCLLN